MESGGLFLRLAPGPGSTVTAGATSTAAQSAVGMLRIAMSVTQPCHIRFGDANVGAATSSDLLLVSGILYMWDLTASRDHFTAIRDGGSDSVITWASIA